MNKDEVKDNLDNLILMFDALDIIFKYNDFIMDVEKIKKHVANLKERYNNNRIMQYYLMIKNIKSDSCIKPLTYDLVLNSFELIINIWEKDHWLKKFLIANYTNLPKQATIKNISFVPSPENFYGFLCGVYMYYIREFRAEEFLIKIARELKHKDTNWISDLDNICEIENKYMSSNIDINQCETIEDYLKRMEKYKRSHHPGYIYGTSKKEKRKWWKFWK